MNGDIRHGEWVGEKSGEADLATLSHPLGLTAEWRETPGHISITNDEDGKILFSDRDERIGWECACKIMDNVARDMRALAAQNETRHHDE